MSGSISERLGLVQCQVEFAAVLSVAPPASFETRVAATGTDATPAMVQLGATRGIPERVSARVTWSLTPIVKSPDAVKNSASKITEGEDESVACKQFAPGAAAAADPTKTPCSFPNGSAPASSRMQHASPRSNPSTKPVALVPPIDTSIRHLVDNVVPSVTASLYVFHTPSASLPVVVSTPRSKHSYEFVPQAAATSSTFVLVVSNPQLSSQQSPPSKHGGKFKSGSHTPSPTLRSTFITPSHG
mmetsp:Transcript_917/g.3504  ORF Transcript_917/g.3504 Transcript_917/m.3504 type:complete len:244 (-) Transcript_917:7024-7755(-)